MTMLFRFDPASRQQRCQGGQVGRGLKKSVPFLTEALFFQL